MKSKIALLLLLSSTTLLAQTQTRESLDPKVTEVWEPKAKKITPGSVNGEAPSDAVVLFGGKDLSEWTSLDGLPAKWEVKDNSFMVVKGTGDIKTKKVFNDMQLHIEWRSPMVIEGEGQGRGNSGIFLQERYELQVLDSYESQTYRNGQAGSIYKQHGPLVNAMRKSGEWQVYDVIYNAPHFNDKGEVIVPAYITVLHNGIVIQNHTEIRGPTEYKGLPVYISHGKGSIKLQDHGNPVSFRNIWVREL